MGPGGTVNQHYSTSIRNILIPGKSEKHVCWLINTSLFLSVTITGTLLLFIPMID